MIPVIFVYFFDFFNTTFFNESSWIETCSFSESVYSLFMVIIFFVTFPKRIQTVSRFRIMVFRNRILAKNG